MPNTPTPRIGFLRPPLGKRPWKREWDFNWGLADSKIGALNDSVATLQGATPDTITGDLTGFTIPSGILDIEVDHSATRIFAEPLAPIFSVGTGVRVIMLGDRPDLTDTSYGGFFRIRVENSTSSDVDGATIGWARKGK